MLKFSPNIDDPAALPSYNHRQKEKKKGNQEILLIPVKWFLTIYNNNKMSYTNINTFWFFSLSKESDDTVENIKNTVI